MADLTGIFQLMDATKASGVGNNTDLNSLGYWTGGNNEGGQAYWQPTDQFNQLVQSGAIKPQYDENGRITDFGLSDDPNAVNTMSSKLPQTAFGGISRDISSLGQTGQQLYQPNVQYNDKNYGQITPSANVQEGHSMFDKIGNMVPQAIMASMMAATMNPGMLAAAGSGVGAGSLASMGLSSPFKFALGSLNSGKIDPMAAANMAAPMIPGVGDAMGAFNGALGPAASFLPTAVQIALNKGAINPIQLMMSLGRMMPKGQ